MVNPVQYSSNLFYYIPDTILIDIFTYLNLHEIGPTSLVDTRFYSLALGSNERLLWKHLCKGRFPRAYERSSKYADFKALCHYKSVIEPEKMRSSGGYLSRPALRPELSSESAYVLHCSLLSDDRVLVCLSSGQVFIWDRDSELLKTFTIDIPADVFLIGPSEGTAEKPPIYVEDGQIHLLLESPNSENPTLQIYDLDGRPVRKLVEFEGSTEWYTKIWGNHAVRGSSSNGRVVILDCTTGKILEKLEEPQEAAKEAGHYQFCWCVDMNSHYIVAGYQGVVRIWDGSAHFLKEIVTDLDEDIRSVRIQGDRLFIHVENTLEIWFLNNFKRFGVMKGIRGVDSFDVDDDYLVTATPLSDSLSPARDVAIWDLKNRKRPLLTVLSFPFLQDVRIQGSSLFLIYAANLINISDFAASPPND
jgi:WD40 repeat protein